MSTTDAGRLSTDSFTTRARSDTRAIDSSAVLTLLQPLASLRLTVVLFALSMVLIMAGTLAQIDHDIWYVVAKYFRAWFAWIDFQVFFPRAWELKGGFWFPGGWLLGAALGVNLLAAHALRFKLTARGSDLWIGLGWLTAGIAVTWLAIQSGLDDTVESELSPEFCNGLWHALRFSVGASALGLGYALALNRHRLARSETDWLWWLGVAACAAIGSLAIWLFANPGFQLDASGLRILWQLIKCGGASIVLYIGCRYLFARRAGIVLLHGGIALMMFSELWTGLQAQEAHMRIAEGETVHWAEDSRNSELALVDKSDPERDEVVTVPLSVLKRAFRRGAAD